MATQGNHASEEVFSYYQIIIYGLISIIALAFLVCLVILFQWLHRPLPYFAAITPQGKQMVLTPSREPNLLPTTITRWAAKAAVAAYTFDFVNYATQEKNARPYFTPQGWLDYQASIANLIQTVRKNQLFVNSVVVGPPVIVNQGDLAGHGYVWRIQMPFLVTYQTAETSSRRDFTIYMTVVRIPTNINPTGIGIDQFVMG